MMIRSLFAPRSAVVSCALRSAPRSTTSVASLAITVPSWERSFHSCCPGTSSGEGDDAQLIAKDSTHDSNLDKLFERNQEWVEDMIKKDPEFFEKLGSGQAPDYLYYGCSDSRVPANQIFGLDAGEVFVHRNVGNLVPGNDLSALSVLEFAVNVLGVKHIIVAGHYDCGAVRAAVKTQDLGMIENWLRAIRDVHRLHSDELEALRDDDEAMHRRLVELNVVEQCLNLFKTGVVQRKRRETHLSKETEFAYPRIHAVVFDPATGLVKKLPVSFSGIFKDFGHIYDLY